MGKIFRQVRAVWLVPAVGVIVLGALALLLWPPRDAGSPAATPAPAAAATQTGAAGKPLTEPEPDDAASASPPTSEYAGPRPSRVVREASLWPPKQPLAVIFASLYGPARAGDARAAYQLGLALHQCADVPHDEAGLQRQLRGLRDDSPDAARLEGEFAHCSGVPADERNRYAQWIRQAAEDGLLEARIRLPFYPPPDICAEFHRENCSAAEQARVDEHRAMLLEHLHAAREAGSADVLWHLGAAYLNGETVERNDILAYGHLRALQAVFRSAGEDDRVAQLLADLDERLLAIERELGEQEALRLLNNPRCCVLFD